MPHRLPSTPAEVLDISTPALRKQMDRAVWLAELLGHWRRPKADAATAVEEMGLSDMFYWAYKTRNPVTLMAPGEDPRALFVTDPAVAVLPEGFEKEATVTIGAAGDLLQAEGLERSRDVLFDSVADLLFGQDVAYANLESRVTRQPLHKEVIGDRAPPIECCSRAQFEVLAGHRGRYFDVLNTANNHALDMGLEGVETTSEALSEIGALDVGTNAQAEDHGRAQILVRHGVKIGFASATFGLNGRDLPEDERWRVNTARLSSKFAPPDLEPLKRQIDDGRAQGCDFIIASVHWGYEFEMFPRRSQVDAARALVEYGADAVLCHHPHVVQPVEFYRTQRDPDRIAVIAYSMGSLTWGFTAPHIVLNMIVNLTLAKGRLGGKARTYIERAAVTPTFRSAVSVDGEILTRIEKLADHVGGRSKSHPRRYIGRIRRYAERVLRARFPA